MPENLETPKVIFWFKVYAGAMDCIYLAVAAASLFFFLMPPDADTTKEELWVIGILCLALGLSLAGVFLVPLVVKPKPWLWTYSLVLICIGMTSACFIPACVPLLIAWIKPQTKAYFGR